jgi:hypothetical protein
MQEYLNKSKPGSDEPVDARLWSSELPEFKASPLTRADYEQVMACPNAFAPMQAEGMTGTREDRARRRALGRRRFRRLSQRSGSRSRRGGAGSLRDL